MNIIIGCLFSIIIACILLVAFYYYMNHVVDQYTSYEKGEIEKLEWYIPPIWVKDAWHPTWIEIETIKIKSSIYFNLS